jgi:hypothetical protein
LHCSGIERTIADMGKRLTAKSLTRARRRLGTKGDRAKFALSPDQIAEISRLSGIPADTEEAWLLIENTITRYRNRQTRAVLKPAQIVSELRKAGQATWELLEFLTDLADALPLELSWRFEKERSSLRQIEIELHGHVGQLKDRQARKYLYGSKSGPETRDAYILVSLLDGIRAEYTGRRIRRSTKSNDTSREFITAVCHIADPAIGSGTIERAMKRVINRRLSDPPKYP